MSSRQRRRRKLSDRPAANAEQPGDCQSLPADELELSRREKGGFLGDWENASRSDLRLLRKAIRENWPVPLERCRPLLEAALSPLFREGIPARLFLAIAWVAHAADIHDLKLREREGLPLPATSPEIPKRA
jgi:hypothetical protein